MSEGYINYQSDFEGREITFRPGCTVFYHGNVWPNLEAMKAKIKYKHQNIILITGRTGTGKTEFAFQLAIDLDPSGFTIDNVFWDTDSLIKVAASKTDIKPPGTVFIFDEAREGTQSLNAMTETNRKMGLFLDTIRSRGYHILLLQPSFFMFQKSIAIYAADLLIHIEKRGNQKFYDDLKLGKLGEANTNEPFTRGMGRIYDTNQKKALYIKGKRMEDMDLAPCTWFSFKKSKGILNWDEYERRKNVAVAKMNEAFDEQVKEVSIKDETIGQVKQRAYYVLNTKCGMKVGKIAEEFDEDQGRVSHYIAKERGRLSKLALEGAPVKASTEEEEQDKAWDEIEASDPNGNDEEGNESI